MLDLSSIDDASKDSYINEILYFVSNSVDFIVHMGTIKTNLALVVEITHLHVFEERTCGNISNGINFMVLYEVTFPEFEQ